MAIFVGDALLAHAKGGCYVCGRGDNLVDLEVQIEGEGALAVCKGCIQVAAEAGGLTLNEAAVAEERSAFAEERRSFSPERVMDLEAELHETQQALELAQRLKAELQDTLSRVARGKAPNTAAK